jgi:SAM-dependent methyltransferase
MDSQTIMTITGGILLGCLLGLSWFAGSDAPYVATKQTRIKNCLKVLGSLKGKNFYELGSGDGRIVLEAAKMGANAFGIEQSYLRVLLSRYQAKKQNLNNAKFIHGDIFKKDIHNANIVFIFLLPKGVEKLEPLLKKLKKGTIVITQTFHFKEWIPYKKLLVSDKIPNTKLSKDGKLEGEFWYYKVL